jgi:hypothetical protein
MPNSSLAKASHKMTDYLHALNLNTLFKCKRNDGNIFYSMAVLLAKQDTSSGLFFTPSENYAIFKTPEVGSNTQLHLTGPYEY